MAPAASVTAAARRRWDGCGLNLLRGRARAPVALGAAASATARRTVASNFESSASPPRSCEGGLSSVLPPRCT